MDIRTLQYFLAVAREESISGAAEFFNGIIKPVSVIVIKYHGQGI